MAQSAMRRLMWAQAGASSSAGSWSPTAPVRPADVGRADLAAGTAAFEHQPDPGPVPDRVHHHLRVQAGGPGFGHTPVSAWTRPEATAAARAGWSRMVWSAQGAAT